MRATRWTAAALGCALLLGACSSGDDAAEDTSTVEENDAERAGGDDGGGGMAEEDTAEEADEDAASDGDLADGADDVVTFGEGGSATTGRQLARTASIILEVASVEQAATRVAAAAQRAGGFVSDAEVRGGDFGSGFLRLRVPARALDATVEDLAAIGVRVVESSISTEDLTDQLTDLDARSENLERLETELRALLTDVRDSDPEARELLAVFERINQVRGEIERLDAQRAAAQDRVALATINVELLPRTIAPEEVEPQPEGTLARAWQATLDAFGAIADALIWLVVTILPVTLAVLGIPALLLWLLARWYRQRRDQRLADTPPAPPVPAPSGDTPPDETHEEDTSTPDAPTAP